MSTKPAAHHEEEDDDWVDDNDDVDQQHNNKHKAVDHGDQGSYDENYDEEKFQAEYEQYMKSLKGGNSKTTTPKASTTTTTNTPSPKKVVGDHQQVASTSVGDDAKQSPTTTTTKSVVDKHHHKRPVPQWKKKSETSDTSSPSPSSANSSPSTDTTNTNTAATTSTTSTSSPQQSSAGKSTTAPSTTTTTTATIPESGSSTNVKSVPSTTTNTTTTTNNTSSNGNGNGGNNHRDRKTHKPQNQSKKHRTEDEAIDFIKTVLGKLVSSFDRLTANAPTPQGYEDTRHKLFKNFSFFRESAEMQTKWIDILFEQAVERGVVGTISNLLNEQLSENVSQLPAAVITTLKKKIALKSHAVFKEEFKLTDPNLELEEEFQFYRRKSNNILFIAKLVGFSIMEKRLAFMIIDELLKNPTLENLKLLSIFLSEVGSRIDGITTKKQVDGYMETIKGLVKTDIPKQLKFDLLSIIELRDKNKFLNVDKQLEALQNELKVVELEDKLAEWEDWYNQLDQKEQSGGSNNNNQQQQKNNSSSSNQRKDNRNNNQDRSNGGKRE